jgi:hypothetical protein
VAPHAGAAGLRRRAHDRSGAPEVGGQLVAINVLGVEK